MYFLCLSNFESGSVQTVGENRNSSDQHVFKLNKFLLCIVGANGKTVQLSRFTIHLLCQSC